MLTRHFGQRTTALQPSPEGRVVGRRPTGWGVPYRTVSVGEQSTARACSPLMDESAPSPDLASLRHLPPAREGWGKLERRWRNHAARLPNRIRFSFCFSWRGGRRTSAAAGPPGIAEFA